MRRFLLLFLLLAHPAWAETLSGKTVRIADGDTITVLDSANRQHKVRIAGIDAPERGQPFYEVSRQNLARLAFEQTVVVEWHKRDRYGRLIGKAFVRNNDVALSQLRSGLAWWYRDYAAEQDRHDRSAYESAEQEARIQRRGLWEDVKAVPPWAWRRDQRAGK